MNDKLISVILTVYNKEKYLNKCIKSILNQTYNNLELILINDGSTDSSGIICDEFASRDSRVRIFHQKNAGQQAAQKKGIEVANGYYISFVDGDDYIDSKMYGTLIDKMKDADLITSGLIKEREDGSIVKIDVDNIEPGEYAFGIAIKYFFDNLIMYSNYDSGSVFGGISNHKVDKIFKTEIVRKIYNKCNIGIRLEEDYLFCMLYALQCNKVIVTHDIYYHYVRTENSITATQDKHFLSDREKIYYTLYNAVKGHKYEDSLQEQLRRRTLFVLFSFCELHIGFMGKRVFPAYDFPEYELIYDKKIILFGAGAVGQSYYYWINEHNIADIVLWVDNKVSNKENNIVCSPNMIFSAEYDLIIISVKNERDANSIRKQLYSLGIKDAKIIWKQPKEILINIFLKQLL